MVRRNPIMGSSVPKVSEKPSKLFFVGGILLVARGALMLIIGLWKANSDYLRDEGSRGLAALKAGYQCRTALAKLGSTRGPFRW